MKVKHLVITMLCILVLIPILTNLIIPHVELYLAEKKIDEGKIEEKQEVLDLLNTTSIEQKKWEIIQKYMIGEGYINRFDLYISPSSSMWGDMETKVIDFTWDEKLPFVIDYVENGPVNGYLVTAAKALAFYYESIGELEKAKSTLFNASSRFITDNYAYQREELLLERIRLTKNHDQVKEANKYIHDLMENFNKLNKDINAQLAQLRAEMILQQGEVEEAYKEITKAIKKYEDDYKEELKEIPHSEEEIALDNYVYYQQLKSMEHALSIIKARSSVGNVVSITGKVLKSDGTPLKGIGIFLRDESEINRSIRPDETFQTITDEEGRFEIRGVTPSNYQITIGVNFDQISGWTWPNDMYDVIEVDGSKDITHDITLQKLIELKSPVNEERITDNSVHFEWEKVDGAHYYELGFGFEIENGWIGSSSIPKITESEIDVPIDYIYNLQGGIAFGDDDRVDPKSLLAYTNPENRFYWTVAAYDKDGNLITESNGPRLDDESLGNLPFFYLKQRELSTTDRLLLAGKIKEALGEYKENYKKDPKDLHSLRMIIRLIGIKEDRLVDRDELAISYMEDLALKSPSANNISQIFMYYYKLRDWELFHKWFKEYMKLEEDLTEYDQSIYATVLMMQGQHTEANVQFKEAMKKDGGNRHIGYWLANELYLNGDFEYALEIAKEFPQRAYGGIVPDWELRVSQMEEESKVNEDYHQQLREALDLYFSGQEEELEEWRSETKLSAMSKFIKAFDSVY